MARPGKRRREEGLATGHYICDWDLLRLGYPFEQATDIGNRRPAAGLAAGSRGKRQSKEHKHGLIEAQDVLVVQSSDARTHL